MVSCGWRHTIAFTNDKQLYSWGIGASGQLGTGSMVNALNPCKIDFLSGPNLKHDELAKAIVTIVEEELPSELRELLGEDYKVDTTFDIPRLP